MNLKREDNSFFVLLKCRTITHVEEGRTTQEAVIMIKMGDEKVHVAFDADTLIGALYGAFKKALESFYPELSEVKLEQYSELYSDNNEVNTIIIITDGEKRWTTLGTSLKEGESRLKAVIRSFDDILKDKVVL